MVGTSFISKLTQTVLSDVYHRLRQVPLGKYRPNTITFLPTRSSKSYYDSMPPKTCTWTNVIKYSKYWSLIVQPGDNYVSASKRGINGGRRKGCPKSGFNRILFNRPLYWIIHSFILSSVWGEMHSLFQASPPQNAVYCFLSQFPVSSLFLRPHTEKLFVTCFHKLKLLPYIFRTFWDKVFKQIIYFCLWKIHDATHTRHSLQLQ
jgi:hypothetical protein